MMKCQPTANLLPAVNGLEASTSRAGSFPKEPDPGDLSKGPTLGPTQAASTTDNEHSHWGTLGFNDSAQQTVPGLSSLNKFSRRNKGPQGLRLNCHPYLLSYHHKHLQHYSFSAHGEMLL